MYTIIVYWNKTSFTRYEHIRVASFSFSDTWLTIEIKSGHVLKIPSTSINRVETIREDA